MIPLKQSPARAVSLPMLRVWKCVLPFCATGLLSAAAAVDEKADPPAPAPEELVRRMGDESYKVREKATRDLWERGDSMLPALREAAAGDNPEIAYRAASLVRKLELFLTADTDEEVVALVERYVKESPNGKFAVMRMLKAKRAWRQMLKLFSTETDPTLQAKLQGLVDDVAVLAARERISREDPAGAREFLEMGPVDNRGLLALATFHLSQGTWDAEWERSGTLKGHRRAMWRLALLRAKGDLAAALPVAREAGQDEVAEVIAALDGDPLPWLESHAARISANSEVGAAYASLAVRKWKGEVLKKNDVAVLVKALGSRSKSTRVSAILALAALGEGQRSADAFAKLSPLAAFAHFEAMDRVPEALAALGLDAENPDYAGWIDERIKQLKQEDIEDQREPVEPVDELVTLAGFLERRGLDDEAWNLYSAPLEKFSKESPLDFEELLGSLFRAGDEIGNSKLSVAPRLAGRIGARWAGDNAMRWETLAVQALGEEEVGKEWWGWLDSLDPDAGNEERFQGLLAMFRIAPDPDRLRDVWMKRIWKAIDAAEGGKRERMLQRVSGCASYTGDVVTYLKAYDQMPAESRGGIRWEERVEMLTAAKRWQDALDIVLDVISRFEKTTEWAPPDLHALAAACLRHTGDAEAAADHDKRLERLVLGDSSAAYMVALRYTTCMESGRAAPWWRKAALWSDSETILSYALDRYAGDLMDSGSWLAAASLGELQTVLVRINNEYGAPFTTLVRTRLQADTARALSRLDADRADAMDLLSRCHQQFATDGSLADFFFPSLRMAGLRDRHDEWFEDTWKRTTAIIDRYPACDNSRNTAAWLAARAGLHLEEAKGQLEGALRLRPDQAAYLDTMAEVHFALKDRKAAIRWSDEALAHSPDDIMLRKQNERFHSAPFPD
ncbi:MAG: hypothetical protein H7A50_05540 [Akkermansiaceae bacterium]|nr:hypothetical protein [Akkermansiaceae bacterium]